MAPFLETLLRRFGEAEIDGAGEELLSAINAPGRQQLLGANDAELVSLLGADEILTAFTSRQRKVAGAHLAATSQIGQQRSVLVIGMRRDHQNAANHVEAIERLAGPRRSRKLALREGRRKTRGHENG